MGNAPETKRFFLPDRVGKTDFSPWILATGMLSLLEILGKVVSMIRLMKPVYP